MSGSWGSPGPTLKRVALDGDSVRSVEPEVDFGRKDPAGFFDVTRDGRLLVWCRETKDGDIWVLDATSEHP